MKRLVPIFLACLCLTACHKATTTDNISATGSANVSDSAIVKCIADYWRQKSHPNEWLEDGIYPAQQPDTSGRLYEAWYDVTGYLVLVNLQDTTVADFLEQHPIVYIPEWLILTDSIAMEYAYSTKYLITGDTVTLQEYNFYTMENNRKDSPFSDTLLIELYETKYLMADKFIPLSHKDTTLRHFDHAAKSYFNERDYNEKLLELYWQIKTGDSISDEQLLDAMPQNRDQYRIYDPEFSTFNERSQVIYDLAVSRAKANPLFRDAYIKMLQWSDAYPGEIIKEVFCPRFFYYDSVYFNEAIQRVLPSEYSIFFDDEWYEWTRTHKDEILSSQP